MKPRVGVSSYPRTVNTTTGPTLLQTASRHYLDSVTRAGGVPMVLPVMAPGDVPVAVEAVDAIVLTGGGDVDPARYGDEPVPELGEVDDARDAFDLRLLEVALERKLPVLAICRGMQVVNVALGGSLIQHVPAVTGQEHRHYERWADAVHRVTLDPDSRLARSLGMAELEVNSLHHQAVCVAAPVLRPVGWAEDGTIEALESPDGEAVVAVQWHPELLPDRPEHQALFRQLVERASGRKPRGSSAAS